MKSIIEQMRARGFAVKFWGEARGFGQKDYFLLAQLANGKSKGVWGRSREIRKMLEAEGFVFGDCHATADAVSRNDENLAVADRI